MSVEVIELGHAASENTGETVGLLDSSVVTQRVFPQSCFVLNKHNSKVTVPVNMRLFSMYIYHFKKHRYIVLYTKDCRMGFFVVHLQYLWWCLTTQRVL